MITGRTRLVGLIGYPVAESLSPRMQNAAFAARGLDWAYVPLPVEPDALEGAVGGLRSLGFAGANVTIPYKTRVIAFCDDVDEVAERAGSVNTLVVQDGRISGSSTDGAAVTGALESKGARVLVLGAGGAAQAIATGLVDAGVSSLTVAARKPDQAQALVLRLHAVAPGAAVAGCETWPPDGEEADVIVNCTPVRDEPVVRLRAGQSVVDLAYRGDGAPTALVEAARAAGCAPVVDGVEVLVRQGAASFERWTGVAAPIDVMRAALRA